MLHPDIIQQRKILGVDNRKLRKSPKWIFPRSLENIYRRLLLTININLQSQVNTILLPNLNMLSQEAQTFRPDTATRIVDQYAPKITALFNTISLNLTDTVKQQFIKTQLITTANNVSTFNNKQFKKVMHGILGIQPFIAEPWLNNELSGFVHQNTELIKSLQNQSLSDLHGIVMRGFQQGLRPTDIVEQIKGRYQVQNKRANLIARDQIGKLNGQLTQLRQKSAGIESYIWRTSMDERVRPEHAEREGQEFRWDQPPDDGNPGEPINCLIGEAKIFSLVYCKKFFRRFYHGKATKIITSSGESIIATPKHPILTTRGWLSAQKINVRDNIVYISPQGFDVFKCNKQHIKPTFKKIFEFLYIIFGVNFSAGSANQFHGDGIVNEQVDIIDMDSCLLNDFEIQGFSQDICENIFTCADMALDFLSPNRSIMNILNALAFPSSSFISFFSKLFSLVFCEPFHSYEVCFRTIAELNIVFDKTGFDAISGDSIIFRKPQYAFTIEILFNNLFFRKLLAVMRRTFPVNNCMSILAYCDRQRIGITRESFGNFMQVDSRLHKLVSVVDKSSIILKDHVYNLENHYGSYIIADNAIVGNCRCTAEPVIKE